MNLDLTETQQLLRDSVRAYLEKEVSFERVRRVERARTWDADLWRDLCDSGWIGLPFPEALGGGGGSLVDAALLVEELARRAAIIPVAEALTAGWIVAKHGPSANSEALVRGLLDGSVLPVPALLEAGDRFDQVQAQVDAGGRLRGEKHFVDYGALASAHLVSARRDDAPGLFLTPTPEPARMEPLHTIGRTPCCISRYDAIAERVAGPEALAELIRLGRAFAAIQCVGSMQQALDMTVKYATLREAFGRAIGTFQAVQHHCANMAVRVASARLLAYEALDAIERGTASDEQVAVAKASASRAVPEVTMLAHQIHGGNGVIEENDLYFHTLRGKERSLAWGTAEECLALIADGTEAPTEWL